MNKGKLVHGVGINDMQEPISKDGKHFHYYLIWKAMLNRCYCASSLVHRPTYIGCSVCDAWKYLSNFKEWYDLNHREGFQLDKDILVEGNKIYSPDTCCFVPQYLNTLLNTRANDRGDLPLGVTRRFNKYIVQCNDGYNGRIVSRFSSLEESVAWYSVTKKRVVAEQVQCALDEGAIDNRIANALLSRKF